MQSLLNLLASQPLLLLFAVIGLGYLAGTIKVGGFSLGPAAVLFAGLFFGALDSRLKIPDLFYIFGLILFVYSIGLQSGPSFFSSFGPRAFKANLMAVAAISLAALLSFLAARVFSLDSAETAGAFCGALTNTPALATSVETIRVVMNSRGLDPGEVAKTINAPVIGYSVTYPFGVVGVLLVIHLYAKIWKPLRLPAHAPEDVGGFETRGPITAKTYRVVNPAVVGRSVSTAISVYEEPGFVLSRMRRGDVTSLAYSETILQSGDLVVVVGEPDAHRRALLLFGEESPGQIQVENQEFDFRRIEVSEKKVVGKMLSSLRLPELLDATVTRIRRGDTDFVPSAHTILERGDRVRITTWAGNMERIIRFFGDSVRSGTEMDFLSLSLGIVLGILLGMLPFPLPGGGTFALGFAGGPLVAGLVLGRIARSGPITWTMPFAVNLSMRQLGLVLFLAGIGTKAGDGFVPTLLQGGWMLMLVGAAITCVVTIAVLYVGGRLLGLPFPATAGMMAGIQTQPACLAYVTELSPSNAPNIWYASVYPVSMVAKILLAQILISHLF